MRKPVKNFRISAEWILQVPKTTESGYFRVRVCDKGTAQVTILCNGNHFGHKSTFHL